MNRLQEKKLTKIILHSRQKQQSRNAELLDNTSITNK